MDKILLLMFHGKGHYNACFQLGRILSEKYEVIFAGHGYFKRHVHENNFQFRVLKTLPFALNFERWVNAEERKKYISLQVIKDRFENRLFKLRAKELDELVRDIKPSHILIDSWQSTDFVVLYSLLKNLRIKTAFIQTMLPDHLQQNIPPLNSLSLPYHTKSVKEAIKKFIRHKTLEKVYDKIRFFGQDNDRLISRVRAINQVPKKYISTDLTLYSQRFNHLPELILSTKEFNFPSTEIEARQHYLGFLAESHREEAIHAGIKKAFSNSSVKPILYCSFGTVAFDRISIITKFLHKLLQGNSDTYTSIIACTNPQILQLQQRFSSAIFLDVAPQLAILKNASVFVTHGGLNSIKESIMAGVPMLVYPLDSRLDHNGNSSRVVYHKLGLRGDIKKDSTEQIKEKIDRLLTDASYKKQLEKFRQYDQRYGIEDIFKLIDTLPLVD